MASDGSITIDFNVNDNSGDTFENFKKKASDTGQEAQEKLSSKFDKPVIAKLDAQAKEAGINNFSSMLKKLPKEQQTQLLAKANKGQVIDFEELLHKIPAKVVTTAKLNDHASIGMKSIQSEAKNTEKRFSTLKQTMLGTMATGVVSAGVGAITSGLKSATQAGIEFNKQQDTMGIVWHNLTTEAPQDGKELINYINSMSQHSIYATDTINKMAQSFYHVHSNVGETKSWTQSFVALGSTLHMTNDQLSESGEQFAKIVAGGKASSEDLNVMINRFPMFGEAIQKATGKSMAQLQQMSAQGKLSAKQFTEALDYLGEKYKGSTSEAMTSMQGMSMYLKSRFSVLSGDVMKSSFNMSKSATTALQKITSDKAMEGYAKSISNALSVAMSWVSKLVTYITAHAKDITGIIGSLVKIGGELARGAWKTFSAIVSAIGDAFGSMSGKSKKSGDSLHNVANALQTIANHQRAVKALGAVIASAFAVKKLSNFVKGVKEVNNALGITSGWKNFRQASKDAGGAMSLFKNKSLSAINAVKKGASGVGSVFTKMGGLIKKGATGSVSALKKMATSLKQTAVAQKILNSAIMTSPITWIVAGIALVVAGFVLLYKNFKPFRQFVNSTVKKAGKVFKTMGKGVQVVCKNIGKWFGDVGKNISKVMSTIGKGISTTWNGIVKIFTSVGSTIGSTVSSVFNGISSVIGSVLKFIGNVIGKTINGWRGIFETVFGVISNVVSTVWNGISSVIGTVIKTISSVIGSTLGVISKVWSATWNGISSFFGGIWGGVTSLASGAMKGIHNAISGALDGISSTWNSVWGGISSFFTGLWDGIVNTVQTAIKKITGFIDGIKDTIGKVGKSISKVIPHFAHGGIVQGNDQLVMVNDGQGEDWKELIKLPTGELTMARDKNAVLPLPVGTRIYSGQDTKNIMDKNGIKQYANGGRVGDVSFPDSDDLEKFDLKAHFKMLAQQAQQAMQSRLQTSQNVQHNTPQVQFASGGSVDLSGNTTLNVNIDGQTFAQQIYPKIKSIQNMDIQLNGQAKGAIYGR